MHEAGDTTEYYFNTQTRMVEKGRLSPWEHLLGPYDTFEEASKALEAAEKRSDAWDEADADWKGED
ncbi:MAG: hypothetical protein CVT68_07385 [Actinobacteria bacterium HGW-Actinobacteria-8]|nr:MAG: hypothetical protein CVT68_07385 [Actinobacteria bacterium HGW-Actinobacteria-8]